MIKKILVISFALLASLAWGATVVYPAYETQQELKKDAQSLDAEAIQTRYQIRKERTEVVLLKTDNKEIAKVAREKFGLCKPGEKIYRFIDEEDFAELDK